MSAQVLVRDRVDALRATRVRGAAWAPEWTTGWRLDPPVVLTMTWVPLVLLLDRGVGIWWQTPLVRAQVAVVVVFATAVEYTFSPLLEVYVYRLGNVPAFVPPGHGLVYLCALAMGRSAWVRALSATR